jgi:hypothetical protein
LQTRQLTLKFLADLIRQGGFCQTLTQEIRVVLFVVLTQLFLDLPELLP